MRAIDLVAALFSRLKPDRVADSRNGILGDSHGNDFEGVDDVFGSDVSDDRFVDRHMDLVHHLDVVLGVRITRVQAEDIRGINEAHVLFGELTAFARIEHVPVELLADNVNHRGLALVGKLIHRLGP